MKSIVQLVTENHALIMYTANRVSLAALTDWFLDFFISELVLEESTIDIVTATLAPFYTKSDIEKLTTDELITRYKKSFERANGNKVNVSFMNGWFRLAMNGDAVRNWSREKVCNAIAILESRKPAIPY